MGPDEAGKVVRIPRDWFGPTDQLVPFGPRATEADENAGIGSHATVAAPLDPNSFWDESSSSIQDVVEAPARVEGVCEVVGDGAVRGHTTVSRPPVFPARAYEIARTAVGVREAAAGIVIAAVIGLSVVGWLAGQPSHRPARSVVPAVSGEQASQPMRWLESSDSHRTPARSIPKTTHKSHPGPAKPHSQVFDVVYHASQTQSVPSPATGGMSSATSTTTQSSRAGAGSGATEASAGAPSHSPPAFGVSSALGPISSPDG